MTQRILIVDDENSARMSTELALTMAGYSVAGTGNGREAIERIVSAHGTPDRFDLLITDLQMPGMSGGQLIDELNVLGVVIPKLVLTGYADVRVITELGRKGCHDIQEKPVDPKALTVRVGDVLQKNMNRKAGWQKGMIPPNPFRLARLETAFNTILPHNE